MTTPTTSDITATQLRAARERAGLSRPAFVVLLAHHGYTTSVATLCYKEVRRIHTIDVDLLVAASHALGIPVTRLLGLPDTRAERS